VFAVYSRRREIWVGWSSVKAIIGTKLALGYLNHYLASRGYSLQMTDEPADPAAPDNLFEPLPGDFGAHGRFDDRATYHCVQLWATRHRSRLLAAFTVFAAVGFSTLLNYRRRVTQRTAQWSDLPPFPANVERRGSPRTRPRLIDRLALAPCGGS
jgi:hypothetical protein